MHDVDPSDLDLRTEKVSALPIINSYLERLDISGLLSGRMESAHICQPAHASWFFLET
ncbi:MAG: hypothetical protein M1477_04860 [Candidatus Thermoplasmatota archaeon]|nr:hypothetical protein [Candidatus Thermoplasmatota archaeon]MCL5989725.1 hypothetical protein [Candidatus Thermoplasmatota archaeon]